jgi:hypothetical protein
LGPLIGGPKRTVTLAAVAVALATASPARAQCRPQGQFSACLDADPLWLSGSPAKLVTVSPASVVEAGEVVVGVATSHATRLVTLEAPAPDPAGRELPLIRRVTTLTVLGAVGVGARSEATMAVPWTVSQEGLGLEGITSQSGNALPKRPLRDPRLGFATVLWRYRGVAEANLGSRYTVAIPLGDAAALAGDRGVVGAPSFTMDLRLGRLFAGTEVSARLRQPTRLADVRLGTQLVVASGIGFEVIEDGGLTLSGEFFAAPTLVEQPVDSSAFAPAEWLISASAKPLGARGPSISLATGGGLPVSTSAGSSVVAMTSPAARIAAIVRQPLPRRRKAAAK